MLEGQIKKLNARLVDGKLICRHQYKIIRYRKGIYFRPNTSSTEKLICGGEVVAFVPGQRLRERFRNMVCEFSGRFVCGNCFRQLQTHNWRYIKTMSFQEKLDELILKDAEREIVQAFEPNKLSRLFKFNPDSHITISKGTVTSAYKHFIK